MKIGIVGSGNMGRALGIRFAALGHEVFFGARNADKARAAAALAGAGAHAGSNDAAVEHGAVVIWTVRETRPEAVLETPSVLAGKVVIELNNRDYAEELHTGKWFEQAIAERLQANAPDAFVVKAFNTIAMETFDTGEEALRESGAQTFIAGDGAKAKQTVAGLAAELGLEAVDVGSGPLALRAVEALGDVIRLIMIDGGRGGRVNLRLTALPEPNLMSIGSRQNSLYH